MELARCGARRSRKYPIRRAICAQFSFYWSIPRWTVRCAIWALNCKMPSQSQKPTKFDVLGRPSRTAKTGPSPRQMYAAMRLVEAVIRRKYKIGTIPRNSIKHGYRADSTSRGCTVKFQVTTLLICYNVSKIVEEQ